MRALVTYSANGKPSSSGVEYLYMDVHRYVPLFIQICRNREGTYQSSEGMTIRLQEVVRSEVDGGLSGPANPIPSESIDCGCGQLPCPKLAKYATRGLFVGLMSWVGLVQAASFAYFHVVGPTIGRRFQFDPNIIDWILVVSELTPLFLGLVVAYWGDRIHRVAWIGGVVLLQSASYFILIIPHLTHRVRVIEETENSTHMSLYADDSPELCASGSSRIIIEEDEPCYSTLAFVATVQAIMGVGNVAYYALGISYLDDNTKKIHVGSFFGVLIAVKILGTLLGYVLAWGCLRIDAEMLSPVQSYQDQIGAWWLGFPILAVLLVTPGLLLSWFPRRLPSEVVEQAAASLLNRPGRRQRPAIRSISQGVGSTRFFPSLGRMFTNKILICNVLASIFSATALFNFVTHENIILESRFHVPRPTGMMLGFGDPMLSRLISSILKPVLIGFVIIISGLVIAKAKPSARFIVGYSFTIIILTAAIIFSLMFSNCDKPPIVGMDKGSGSLLKYCNRNCGCSKDSDFRPICDSKGLFTFYSPCHAGCVRSDYLDSVKTYSGCSCVEEMTGMGNQDAKEGPCVSSSCQAGWLIFEFGALLAYALAASTIVGDLMIALRSVYKQDKAISIGFWMTWVALFANVPGKILYQTIADMTCQHWGNEKSVCHLHDSYKLGDYLCYLTASLLLVAFLLKLLLFFFCNNLSIYHRADNEIRDGPEAQELMQQPTSSSEQRPEPSNLNNNNLAPRVEAIIETEPKTTVASTNPIEEARREEEAKQTKDVPLKYGPLGPGDRRTDPKTQPAQEIQKRKIQNPDSEDDLDSSSDEASKKDSRIAYRPLELDSDVESDLSTAEPRSRRRVISKDYSRVYQDENSPPNSSLKRDFPNPDNYGDPRLLRNGKLGDQNRYLDGSSKTSSFEFSRKGRKEDVEAKGDFNEVGIPTLEPGRSDSRFLKDVKSLIDRYEQNTSNLEEERSSVKSSEGSKSRSESKVGIPLVAMAPGRASSRARSSSGFESLPDVQDEGDEGEQGGLVYGPVSRRTR
ncbi:hypothetical protein KM043_007491 [Ampulex compressa]|nr:hypothetical protein KM043_007491 [Ampulex compressa]